MKSLKDILQQGIPEEFSDKDLETSILEAAHSENPPKIEKPAAADKVTAAMAHLSDMVTMADEMYYTLSDLEEIEEEMVGKIETIFASLDDLYKEVDETYDIVVPEMGATSVEEAEEILGRSLDSILNETYETLKEGKFNRLSLLRTMKKPEGVIQTSSGRQYTIFSPKNREQGFDTSELWLNKSIFAMDRDGVEVEINYDDITSYSEAYENAHMPKTKDALLTAMKRELRGMKVADLKASYQYIKAAHCNTKESMHGMGTKKDTLMAMYKDLQAMKKSDLMASYEYIKSAHCGPHEAAHEPEEINAAHCTSESAELEEMKTKDDDLAVMIYDYIGADTEGLPLKTLIHQAVGKYFGSQKDKKK